jgi:hypothetical protein
VRHPSPKTLGVALASLIAVGSGCDRDGVTHYRVPKTAPADATVTTAASASTAPPGMTGDVPPPSAPRDALRWTLPKGWTESRGGAMRFATLKPPDPGQLDASVVVLPGPAGGELANVNRWRGQIGLPPLDEQGLARARTVTKTRAGPLKVYDFSSEGTPRNRVVAGLIESAGNTWFVKLSGEADAVGRARSDFMQLLGSLRFDESR